MQQLLLSLGLVWALAGTAWPGLQAFEDDRTPEPEVSGSRSWWTGGDFSFGDLVFPHFHFIGVVGESTDDPARLALGEHDPQQENFNLLALEPAMSLRLGDHLEGFIVHSYVTDATGDFGGGMEEGFLKLTDLPGGFEVRGGRFFNRVGFQNARHSHAWEFFDQQLMNGRLLQEGELASVGGDVTWYLPTRYASALTLSLGGLPPGHGHGEAFEDEEPLFEAEAAGFDDYIASLNLLASWHYNDFHQFTGTANFTFGENGFGEDTEIFGAGLEYRWRENGLEAGGRHFLWRTETMLRHIEARRGHAHHDEAEHHGSGEKDADQGRGGRESFDELGFYTMLTYGFIEHWEASLRAGYVEGLDDFNLDERWRISPALTWSLNRNKNLYLRLQYNYDHSDRFGEAHALWCGLGVNWGGPEVR